MHDKISFSINNIINYLRRSRRDEEKERRTGEDTLEDQRKLMTRVLDDLGIPYEQKFEIGSGDQIDTRPVFKEIIEDLKAGKYDAIAVKEISRLGRGSYTDMGVIYDLVAKRRIYIITPWKIYDPMNNADLRQIRFELFMSREEFETIRERMTGARYSAAMEGKWMGRVPYGYRRHEKTGRLVIVPDEAKIVQLIFDLYVNGLKGKDGVREMGSKAISTYLNRLGILSPDKKKLWHTSTIERTLMRRAYIGTVTYRTTERIDGKVKTRPKNEHIIVEDAHEPIIDNLLFYEAQKKLKGASERKSRKVRLDFNTSELTGLLTCSECGKRLIINRHTRKYKKKDGEVSNYFDFFLRCSYSGCIITRYEPIERKVRESLNLLATLDNDKISELIANRIKEEKTKPDNSFKAAEEIQKTIKKRKEELKKRLIFIAEKHFDQTYSDEDYKTFKSEIEEELAKLEKVKVGSFNETATTSNTPSLDPEQFKVKVTKIAEMYDSLETPEDKNKLLLSVFKNIVLKVVEKGNNKKEAVVQLMPVLNYNFVLKDEVMK